MSCSTPLQHIICDLIQPQTDHLTRRIASHCDAINNICHLHGIAVMCDHNELCVLAQFLQEIPETSYIRFIQHCVHFVHHTDRRRRNFNQGEHQCHSGQTSFTT